MLRWWPGLYHHAVIAPGPLSWPAAMFSELALVPARDARSPKLCLPGTGDLWSKKPNVAMSCEWSRAALPSFSSMTSSGRPST
jgi:hypothetical protein